MKRISTLMVLLGLAVGMMLTGCKPAEETTTPPPAGTNATPPSMPATNK